ncbi:MAG: hypothetical protein HY966_03885, partial [Ignavibacteriales bacterium]|nr:hypothetical protein [Ignavibacteriales bacterium]
GSSSPNLLFWGFSVAALVYGSMTAYQLRWLCDDIFITLRYVENWLNGLGVVYNAGERVEGYTHFLWMALIAFFQWLGSNPRDVVYALGLASFAATLATLIALSWKAHGGQKLFLPLAAVVLALHFDFKIWATSGLETSLFTFLVLASIAVLAWWRQSNDRSHALAGLLLTCAMMTRPDGILFTMVAGMFVVVRSIAVRKTWKATLRATAMFAAPFVVVYLPYVVWKYSYYGDLFPNTYYAKSGALNYFSQGWIYIGMYVQAYVSSFLLVLGIGAVWMAWNSSAESWRQRAERLFASPIHATIVLSMLYVVVYVVGFVARVGGDFMYARFLHPVLPPLYVAVELSLLTLLAKRPRWLRIAFVVLPLLAVYEHSLRMSIFVDENGKRKGSFLNGVTDEHWYWTQTEQFGMDPISMNEFMGRQLAAYFQGERVSVLLRGQASLGYYAKFADCVENAGLTDAYIARLPLAARSRPGHEKNAPVEYLLKRGVHFVFMRSAYDTASYRQIYFRMGSSYARAEMFFYDAPLLHRLKVRFGESVEFQDFTNVLDHYIATIKSKPREEVARDYGKFNDYYFARNADPQRNEVFQKYLEGG